MVDRPPPASTALGDSGSSPLTTEQLTDAQTVASPPLTLWSSLSHLGPGLIIAAAIVGSGELIGTTLVGAQSGFWLLWLILIGCVIKVFVQVEFGRVAVVRGLTALEALDQMPGKRLGTHWLVWCWLTMFVFTVAQLGGIVGGVGEAMALCLPLRGDYVNAVQAQLAATHQDAKAADTEPTNGQATPAQPKKATANALAVYTWDEVFWSALVTLVTALLLANGKYGVLQNASAILVAWFTVVTVLSLIGIQADPRWRIQPAEWQQALGFRLPPGDWKKALATAFSVFGIIGVGASELISYPYWCLEKGYARWTGVNDGSPAWTTRALGWLRVMRLDALCSLLVYTLATAAFYLLGAAVLHRQHLEPANSLLIPTLERIYADNPFFLGWGKQVFLLGAFAVLYSTFLVATAGNARMAADAMGLFGLTPKTLAARTRWTQIWCVAFPFISLAVYMLSKAPLTLVLLSGVAQAAMLPLLTYAALYYRYRRCPPSVQPGWLWDLGLWCSAVAMCLAGILGVALKLFPAIAKSWE